MGVHATNRTSTSIMAKNDATTTRVRKRPRSSFESRKRVRLQSLHEQEGKGKGKVHHHVYALHEHVLEHVLAFRSLVSHAFLDAMQQKVVTPVMREIVVDWLMEVAAEYHARCTTLALAVSYMDRFLSLVKVPVDVLQLVAVTCMLLASKIEETNPPSIADVVYICDHTYTAEMVLSMEKFILNQLKFTLTTPTPFTILGHLAELIAPAQQYVNDVAQFAAHFALFDDQLADVSPGVVALGAVQLALHIAPLSIEKGNKRAITNGPLTNGIVPAPIRAIRQSLIDKVARRLLKMWNHIIATHDIGNTRWLVLKKADMAACIFGEHVVHALHELMRVKPRITGEFGRWVSSKSNNIHHHDDDIVSPASTATDNTANAPLNAVSLV